VFLVGGFAESPYMYHKINEYCSGLGLEAVKPGNAYDIYNLPNVFVH
jgi:hypothetical protein